MNGKFYPIFVVVVVGMKNSLDYLRRKYAYFLSSMSLDFELFLKGPLSQQIQRLGVAVCCFCSPKSCQVHFPLEFYYFSYYNFFRTR